MTTSETLKLKNVITVAAVAWERAYHERVDSYKPRDLKEEESLLITAVQAYNSALISADVKEEP